MSIAKHIKSLGRLLKTLRRSMTLAPSLEATHIDPEPDPTGRTAPVNTGYEHLFSLESAYRAHGRAPHVRVRDDLPLRKLGKTSKFFPFGHDKLSGKWYFSSKSPEIFNISRRRFVV